MKDQYLKVLGAAIALIAANVFAQSNGKLQIHYMDVNQGDGAVLISPKGQIVMFDSGALVDCTKPLAYLESIGVTAVDYHIASHYHADHIGCASEVFSQVTLKTKAYDRGRSYSSAQFNNYVSVTGNKRTEAQPGDLITLDANTPNPVKITIVATNGNGIATTDENDLSVVALVEFGGFRTEFGGDLSGQSTTTYKDIESSVAPKIGRIDVYKVHHHCSSHSSNTTWLQTTKPTIGIISVGNGNRYGHPTEDCLMRLHEAGVKTYWTEQGKGADPDPQMDVIAGTVVVEVVPGASQFTVSYHGHAADKFPLIASAGPGGGGGTAPTSSPVPGAPQPKFVWAKKSTVYHLPECLVAKAIKTENLVSGDTPPAGRHLHKDCPKLN